MRILLFIYATFLTLNSGATHIIGGELYYDHLGGDQYQVTLKLFRDCGPGNVNNTQYDATITIGVFGGDGTVLPSQALSFPGASNVPIILDDPCLTAPPTVCVELAIYTGVFTLPARPDGYHLTFQRCCRSPTIVNIPNAEDLGLTCTVRIPGTVSENSSARFIGYPPIALCLNEGLVFDHSASDADGDSLVYELCTPYNGGTPIEPIPVPAAPPYVEIPWGPDYSESYQIDSDPVIQIDAQTGILTVRPTLAASYTVAIRVKEYRAGVLLSETRRDLRFDVVPCESEITAVIGPQTPDEYCAGLSIDFENESPTGTTWAWDFGEQQSTSDSSSMTDPSWTYAAPGTYTVALIANPGTTCADTTQRDFILQVPPTPAFAIPDTVCGTLATELVAGGAFSAGSTFYWNFGTGATPATSTASTAQVQFAATGPHAISLTVDDGGCIGVANGTVVAHPQPGAFFTAWPPSPQSYGTDPVFVDASTLNGAALASAEWSVAGQLSGVGAQFTLERPLPGTHVVELTIVSVDGCASTYRLTYEISEVPIDIPNVMTPNQDGQNETFNIANIEQHRNQLNIYNRWGNVVYEATNYRNQWTALGVPDGTYYYELLLADGAVHTGHLTVLR